MTGNGVSNFLARVSVFKDEAGNGVVIQRHPGELAIEVNGVKLEVNKENIQRINELLKRERDLFPPPASDDLERV